MAEAYISSMLTFYGYKKCSTCRRAEKALTGAGRKFTFVDITAKPPSQSELKRIWGQTGLPLRKIFNTSGEQYKTLRIKDRLDGLNDAQALDLLAQNGRLIKRPLVTDGRRSTVGFDPAAFSAVWK